MFIDRHRNLLVISGMPVNLYVNLLLKLSSSHLTETSVIRDKLSMWFDWSVNVVVEKWYSRSINRSRYRTPRGVTVAHLNKNLWNFSLCIIDLKMKWNDVRKKGFGLGVCVCGCVCICAPWPLNNSRGLSAFPIFMLQSMRRWRRDSLCVCCTDLCYTHMITHAHRFDGIFRGGADWGFSGSLATRREI